MESAYIVVLMRKTYFKKYNVIPIIKQKYALKTRRLGRTQIG